METSTEIKDLAMALSKAQANFTTIPKTKHAKFKTKAGFEVNYAYADLTDVVNMYRKPLTDQQLCLTQSTTTIDNSVIVTTMLLHATGQFIKNELKLPPMENLGNAIQSIGGTITMARRYEACSILGISSDEDVDGAQPKGKEMSGPKVTQQPAATAPSQSAQRTNLLTQLGLAKQSLFKLTKKHDEFYKILGDMGFSKEEEIPDVPTLQKFYTKINNHYLTLKDMAP